MCRWTLGRVAPVSLVEQDYGVVHPSRGDWALRVWALDGEAMITATRYYDFSYGHRVSGHENKCAHLHGHNGRVHFTCSAEHLDSLGRVLDFGVINTCLCLWIEEHWDHRFLAFEGDEIMQRIDGALQTGLIFTPDVGMICDTDNKKAMCSLVWLPFNPTAENLADHLLRVVGPAQLRGTGVRLIRVIFEETRKCSAEASL